jgi:hypothetical protein
MHGIANSVQSHAATQRVTAARAACRHGGSPVAIRARASPSAAFKASIRAIMSRLFSVHVDAKPNALSDHRADAVTPGSKKVYARLNFSRDGRL